MFEKVKDLLFRNTSTRQTVAKNTFWLAVSNIGGRLLRAIIIIYAARVLGTEQWGVFSYAITLAAFLTIFIDFGINNILTRETAKLDDIAARLRVLGTAFVLKGVLLALGILIIIYIAPLATTIAAAKALFPVVALIVVFDTIREFGLSLVRGLEKMEWEAGLFLLTNVAIVLFGFLFLALGRNVMNFTYAYAAGTGVGALATAYALRSYLGSIFTGFRRSLVKFILVSAWPFAISGILGTLLTNTDILVIGWFRSAEEIGQYAAGLRIVQLLYILPAILASSLLPVFARLANADNERLRRVTERIVGVAFLAAVPLAVGGIITGPALIPFLFGSSYSPGVLAFQILMLTMLVDFPAVILSSAIFAYDRQRTLVVYAALGGFLNVLLDLLLIPTFGITGSAVTTLIAQIASNAYLWHAARDAHPTGALRRLARIVLAALVMGLVIGAGAFIDIPVLANIALGAIVYFGALILLNEPLLAEMRAVLRPPTPTPQKAAS
jgi:O-antigen/teichoic acid export membrane protein